MAATKSALPATVTGIIYLPCWLVLHILKASDISQVEAESLAELIRLALALLAALIGAKQ